MSGPKGGAYVVISAAELERRALRTAQDRYARVVAELDVLVDSLSGFGERVGRVSGISAGMSSVEVQAEVAVAEKRVRELSDRLTSLRVAAALKSAAPIKLSIVFNTPPRSGPTDSVPAATTVSAVAARAERLVERMLAELGDGPVARLRLGLESVYQSRTDAQAQLALDELSLLAQGLRREHEQREHHRRDRLDALGVLDGCVSREAQELRDRIRRLEPGEPLPVPLVRVRAVAAEDARQQDAAYVEEAVVDVLQELGYDVGTPMDVAIGHGGVFLEVPGFDRHIARLRRSGDQLQFNVISVGGKAGRERDSEAEVSACEVFEEVHTALAQAGVEWRLERRDPPGAVPVATITAQPKTVVTRAPDRKSRGRNRASRERTIER